MKNARATRPIVRATATFMAFMAVLQIRPATGAPGDIFTISAPGIGSDPPKATDIKDGDASVATQTGALQYSYPIVVPPGRNGVTPQLSLGYSSQGPTHGGIAAGWTLSIPMISEDHSQGRLRTRSSMVEAEQAVNGKDPKSDDRFVSSMAGGRPLVAVTEPTGVASDVYMAYRAQNDTSFTRYERMKPSTPYRWRARTSDGNVWKFGEASNVAGCVINDQYAPLTSMTDPFGNEVRYIYNQAVSGECRPMAIAWGRNATANLQDFAQVVFDYDTERSCNGVHTNSQTDYRSGIKRVTGASRLRTITVTAFEPGNSSAVVHTRQVNLAYDELAESCNQPHAPVRLLTSIQESAWGSDSPRVDLPPVTFDYNSPQVTLLPPQGGAAQSPWPQTEVNNQGAWSLGWGFRRGDDRWSTVETMFLDIDGDGLQDVVMNDSRSGTAVSNCGARWYKNRGPDQNGRVTFAPPPPPFPELITLPRLKWRGSVSPHPVAGATQADSAYPNFEACSLNGQVTAFMNANPVSGACHHEPGAACIAGSDSLDQTQYCRGDAANPGYTRCPKDPGSPPANVDLFRTYLAYRWLDMDADGLVDLVAAVHGDIDSYDIERGDDSTPFDYSLGEPSMFGIPALDRWPSCSVGTAAAMPCKRFGDCLDRQAARTCDATGCTINWAAVVACVTTTPTQGCAGVLAKQASGPDGVPPAKLPHTRHPYERCEGRYPWFIYKNQGGGRFASTPVIKYQPIPLESSSGDSALGTGGMGFSSESHAVTDFDGDGWLDAVVRGTDAITTTTSCTTNADCATGYWCDQGSGTCAGATGSFAWQVWLGDGTGAFGPQMHVFPTRSMSPCPPGTFNCLHGGNAISGVAGSWGQSTFGMVGLADVNGDGAQDHWIANVSTKNANVAFNYGDKIHLVAGTPPTGELTTPTGAAGDWIKPGNDTLVCVPDPTNQFCINVNPFQAINAGRTSAGTRVADIDHDGRPDVVTFASATAAPKVHFNVGGQFNGLGIAYSPGAPADVYDGIRRRTEAADYNSSSDDDKRWRLKSDLIDLDGDGISEGVFFDPTLGFRRAQPDSTQPPRLLRAVHNGRGAHTAVTYAQMHDTLVVEQHPELTWPDGRPKASPRTQWVVKSLRVTDDHAATNATTQYFYKNPRFSADDEAHYSFRGFEEVKSTKPGPSGAADGARTIERYAYDVDWSGRLVATVVMPSAAEGATAAHTIDKTRWQPLTLFGGRIKSYHPEYAEHFICGKGQNEASCESAPAGYTRTTSTWTAYPNTPLAGDEQLWVESATLLQKANASNEGDRQTLQKFELASAAQQYWLRPYETEQLHRIGGAMVTFAKSRQTWDPVTGTQLTDETWVGSDESKRAITRYAYDDIGNRTKVWKPEQWAVNTDPLTNLVRTTLEYDARRLLVARETNELGHVQSYTYEYGTGTKLRTQGPNEAPCAASSLTPCPPSGTTPEESRIRVDGLGRIVERFQTFATPGASYVVHKVETNTYVDAPLASITHQSAIDHNESTLAVRYAQDRTELDGHGRPIRKTTYVFGSAPANHVTTFTYRHDGTLAEVRVPDPTVNSSATLAYAYTFDSLGRPLTIRRPDATATADRSGVNLSYDGLVQTSAEMVGLKGGKPASTKTTKDSFGRLVRVDEQLTAGTSPTWATTTYGYDPGDRVAKIIDAEGVTTDLEHDYAGRRTKITRAGRAWKYGYDRNGNMLTETSPCSGLGCEPSYTTAVSYDVLDRPTSKLIAPRDLSLADRTTFGSSAERYTYDVGYNGKGRLHRWETRGPSASTPMQVVLPTWNAQGQPFNLEQQFSGAEYTNLSRSILENHYISGQRASVYYRDVVGSGCSNGSASQISYDARGLPYAISLNHCLYGSGPFSYIVNERNVAGLVTKRYSSAHTGPFTYVESKWIYDALGRVTDQTIKKGSALEQVARQSLDYYGNDDPKSMTHWLGTSNQKLFSFEYDQRHQLEKVTAGTAFSATYTYRDSGRFKTALQTAAALPGSDVKPRNVTYQYAGVDPEQVTALKAGTTTYASYTYDLAGNQNTRTYPASGMTPAESWTYVYDGKNQLRRATRRVNGTVTGSEEYWYDHNGARQIVVKRDAANAKTGMIWFIGETEAHYNATGTPTQVYAHVTMGTPVARFVRRTDGPAIAEYQFHGLANNTLAAINQADGKTNASFMYAPFGEIIEATDAGAPTDGTAQHRRRMNDKFVDDISGLAYYGFRYYDKTSMTWTQSDPLYRFAPDAAWLSPREATLYTFVLNNPVRYIDPDGRQIDGFGREDDRTYAIERKISADDPGLAAAATVIHVATAIPRGVVGFLLALDDSPNRAQSTPPSSPPPGGLPDFLPTSRAARREAMRQEGIPTSQQPAKQSKDSAGRTYDYPVPKQGGGTQTKSVQDQTKDRSHPGEPHWEAGSVKTDEAGNVRRNKHGRPKLKNDKSKVRYPPKKQDQPPQPPQQPPPKSKPPEKT